MVLKKLGTTILSLGIIGGGVMLVSANSSANKNTERELKTVSTEVESETFDKDDLATFDIIPKAEEVKEIKRDNLNDFLFIGDSFTALLKDTIITNNDNAYVHAKSGSRPSYWLDKVESMPNESDIEGIVLLIGVNGASTDSNKTDVITLIDKISEKYPNTKVYVQKIFPVGDKFESANPDKFNESIDTLNEIIEKYVNVLDNFTFIDTTNGFVDENGYLTNTYDELHISPSHHQMQYDNILNAVSNAELK